MSTADEMARRLEEFEGRVAQVGWFESAQYPNGMPVASVALIHEFGAPGANIPARPFLRPTIAEHQAEWREKIIQGIRAVGAGAMTADDVLTQIGALAAGQTRQTISNVREPALAASTLESRERRGRTDQPLNDSGYMIATLTNAVGDAEE